MGLALADFSEAHKAKFLTHTDGYSPADFIQLLTNLERKHYICKRNLTGDEVLEVARDFIPSDISLQRELQSMLAFVECSYQSMVPEKYAALTKEEAYARIGELKRLLGEN